MIALNGAAIRIARAMRDMSQVQLAQAAGLKIHRLWSIENDVCPARPDELALILRALSTDDGSAMRLSGRTSDGRKTAR